MGCINDDQWLDEALNKAIPSDDTRPDFEKWKKDHPEAVKTLTSRTHLEGRRPLWIRRIIMNGTSIKIAAAAVIAVAGIVGIATLTRNPANDAAVIDLVAQETLAGPTTHTFADRSTVKLAEGASIRTLATAGKRGFEHLAGEVEVTVAKGKGEFIVTTPYGDVKALGTEFTLELVDGTADSGEKVELLAVEVTEGKVEISNAKGSQTLRAAQETIVEKDAAPYDFNRDEALPARLKERIRAMVGAFEAGDAAAWAANFNIHYMYQLGKGQVRYDPLLFGGSKEDAERLQEMLKDIESPEQLSQVFLSSVNITEPVKIYVRSVKLSADGNHAWAECVRPRARNHVVLTGPQWHYFDNDWWQIDD